MSDWDSYKASKYLVMQLFENTSRLLLQKMHPENVSLNKFNSSIYRADIFSSQKYFLQMAFCRKDWGVFLCCYWTKLKCCVQLQNISGKELISWSSFGHLWRRRFQQCSENFWVPDDLNYREIWKKSFPSIFHFLFPTGLFLVFSAPSCFSTLDVSYSRRHPIPCGLHQ